MNSRATNRDELIRIASATLASLQSADGIGLIESLPASEDAQANSALQRDIVTDSLAAALDYARIESELINATGSDFAESAQNLPYIPSNRALALLQSAIEEFEEAQGPAAEEAFDPTDPGWLSVAWEKLKGLLRGKRKFIKHTDLNSFRYDLPANAVVALFSDWGTGEETAARVMVEIKKTSPSHAIHLGDVYYSGTEKEVQRRFLDPIAAHGPSPNSCRYLALNSNHEMYSGGYAYFDMTLPRFAQEASYFNLRNTNWQLIGLDSGHEDHGLRDPQDKWLAAQLNTQAKNILLSHHQIFSPFEKRAFGQSLEKKVRPLLGGVYGWFWGHEHKALVFGQHEGIKARCIGHGALPTRVPYGQPRFPGIPIQHVDERSAPGTNGEGIHGFALLRFQGAALRVSYIDEFGTTWFEEEF